MIFLQFRNFHYELVCLKQQETSAIHSISLLIFRLFQRLHCPFLRIVSMRTNPAASQIQRRDGQ